MTKGIILAGGAGKRLYPATKLINKHLMNIYNKPMIYYPLSILILNKIKDILVVCNKEDLKNYKKLLSNGQHLGIKITYKVQGNYNGIVGALLKCEEFIKNEKFLLMLGDNFFYGNDLINIISEVLTKKYSPTIFTYHVSNYRNFGIVEYTKSKIKKIHEKPKKSFSNLAVLGMYYLDAKSIKFAKKMKKSKRGEFEITDLLNTYIRNKIPLNDIKLGRGVTWFDMGTFEDYLNASLFVKIIEQRQNLKIGSITEAAYLSKFINYKKFKYLSEKN